jgi:hypothetical protein
MFFICLHARALFVPSVDGGCLEGMRSSAQAAAAAAAAAASTRPLHSSFKTSWRWLQPQHRASRTSLNAPLGFRRLHSGAYCFLRPVSFRYLFHYFQPAD